MIPAASALISLCHAMPRFLIWPPYVFHLVISKMPLCVIHHTHIYIYMPRLCEVYIRRVNCHIYLFHICQACTLFFFVCFQLTLISKDMPMIYLVPRIYKLPYVISKLKLTAICLPVISGLSPCCPDTMPWPAKLCVFLYYGTCHCHPAISTLSSLSMIHIASMVSLPITVAPIALTSI